MRKDMLVCDICQDVTLPVVTYQVATAGRTVKVELCANHAAPLEEILATAEEREPPRRGRGSGRLEVMSMEDVERARRRK